MIVGSSDRHVTKLEGGLLSSAYVLGTAVTYTVAGVIAGATGDQLQAYFQHPAAIVTFGTLLGFLALSMFGFTSCNCRRSCNPSCISTRPTSTSRPGTPRSARSSACSAWGWSRR